MRIAFVAAWLLSSVVSAEGRDWTNADGTLFAKSATLLVTGDEEIVLRRADGSTLEHAREDLSTADLDFVEAIEKKLEGKPSPRYWLQRKHSGDYEAEYVCHIESVGGPAYNWRVWVPHPPQLAWQRVGKYKVLPSARRKRESSGPRRFLWEVEVRASKEELPITVRMTYRLFSTQLRRVQSDQRLVGRVEISDGQRKQFLAASKHLDYKSEEFQAFLIDQQLRRRDKEGAVDFARRVLLWLQENYRYVYHPDLDRKATSVSKQKANDCGGLSNLVVAVLRANQIPSRAVVGRWTKPRNGAGLKIPGEAHIVAEFYVEDTGWVPFDTATTVVQRYSRGSFPGFGRLDDFVALHFDTDFRLTAGEKLIPYLQTPAVWAKARNRTPSFRIQQSWNVKKITKAQVDAKSESRNPQQIRDSGRKDQNR